MCLLSLRLSGFSDLSGRAYFHSPIFTISERLQGEEQFHSKKYLSEMHYCHAKIRFKSAPQKLIFLMATDISKSYTLDCS